MRGIDRQVLRTGLGSLAILLLLVLLVGPKIVLVGALGFSLSVLVSARTRKFRAGHQTAMLVQRHGIGAPSPDARRCVRQVRRAILVNVGSLRSCPRSVP